MAYFKINDIDFSQYVNALEVTTVHNYKSRTNAAGNLNVKYINEKKVVTVGIIPLNDTSTTSLLSELNKFKVTVSYLEPETNELKTITCIAPKNSLKYYKVIAGDTMLKAYSIQFTEL